jgi:hypothetical protein
MQHRRPNFERQMRRDTKAEVKRRRAELQAQARALEAVERFERMINPQARPRRRRK